MINTYKALIKREFWEHRGAFIKTPIIIGTVMFVLTVGAYITTMVLANKSGAEEFTKQGLNELSKLTPEQLSMFWEGQTAGLSTLFLVALFFVLFFFLLGSLYDDRKDQSILFWKSLPVSDANTVMSKLLTAMIFVPLAFVAIFVLTSLVLLIFSTIVILFHGLNPIQLVWAPSNMLYGVVLMLTGIFVQMLWALPIYGWLMFSSSFSKRRPFLFAIFVPAIIAFSWYWINALSFQFTNFKMFMQPLKYLGRAMFPYASGSLATGGFQLGFEGNNNAMVDTMQLLKTNLMDVDIIYGAILAAILVSLAIWLRRYRNTT